MAEFIARWFTPSKSDQGAPIVGPMAAQRPAELKQEERIANRPKKKTISKFGGVSSQPSLLQSEQATVAKTLLGQ